MKSKILLFTCVSLLTAALCGCGQNKQQEEAVDTLVVAPNDWHGAFSRLAKIQTDVMNTTSILDEHNYTIIQGQPDDYWNNEEFHYLKFIPMNSNLLGYTQLFQSGVDVSALQETMSTMLSEAGYTLASLSEVGVNHYTFSLTYHDKSWRSWTNVYKEKNVDCVYDASHDWLQMSTSVSEDFRGQNYEEELYEFADLGDKTFALQNEKERLYVKYDSDGKISEYYHTVLPDVTESMAKEFYAEQNTEDADIQKVYEGIVNADNGSKTEKMPKEETAEEETYGIYYTKADNSIFKHLDSVKPEWVQAAGNFQSIIEYKDHILSVSVKNNLTDEMESFSVKEKVQEETTDETLQGLSGGGNPE